MNINPMDILKNAQKIQEQMGSFQEKLAGITVKGSSGGGMVEIEINGKFEVTEVKIAAEAVEEGDVEMLQDLVMAAFARAVERIQGEIKREIGAMTGGLNIPGLSGLMGNM